MGWASDLRILYHLTLKRVRGRTHADRLESFYRGQAEAYDDFRRRLLPGRAELHQALDWPSRGVWVDLGGGTGANLQAVGPRLAQLAKVYVVDLSPSLLDVARRRCRQHGWQNVALVQDDATRFLPPEGQVDVVTFSYSLTMIPDWFAAIEQAHRMLRPGGQLGVVDFYVSRKYPEESRRRHGPWTRGFWPLWFGRDNVFLSPDHLPYLCRRFQVLQLQEHRARLPYVPLARVPYYWLVGVKRDG